jgi:hypothetical protein
MRVFTLSRGYPSAVGGLSKHGKQASWFIQIEMISEKNG